MRKLGQHHRNFNVDGFVFEKTAVRRDKKGEMIRNSGVVIHEQANTLFLSLPWTLDDIRMPSHRSGDLRRTGADRQNP